MKLLRIFHNRILTALSIALLSSLSSYAKQLPTDGLVRMNMMINYMLAQDTFPPVLDMNWDGELDIADVNGAITAILDGRPVSPVKTLHFNGVPVKMIYVEGTGGDTVTMRAGDRSKRIKVDDFWIAETKCTHELYGAVSETDSITSRLFDLFALPNENAGKYHRYYRMVDENDIPPNLIYRRTCIYPQMQSSYQSFTFPIRYDAVRSNYDPITGYSWDTSVNGVYNWTVSKAYLYPYKRSESNKPVTGMFRHSSCMDNSYIYQDTIVSPAGKYDYEPDYWSNFVNKKDRYIRKSTPTSDPSSNATIFCLLMTEAMGNGERSLSGNSFSVDPLKQIRFPSEDEWNYAACGGRYSQGFAYSGSNTKSEVYQQIGEDVAQHKHNELGLYDMSSDVFELCGNTIYGIADTVINVRPWTVPWKEMHKRDGLFTTNPFDMSLYEMSFRRPASPTTSPFIGYIGDNDIPCSFVKVNEEVFNSTFHRYTLIPTYDSELMNDIDTWYTGGSEKWEKRMKTWGVPIQHFMGQHGLLGETGFIAYYYPFSSKFQYASGCDKYFSISSLKPKPYTDSSYKIDNYQSHLFMSDTDDRISFRIAVSSLTPSKQIDYGPGEYVFY